ncbi:MAG TPA: hypothetical protein VFB58_18615 [Chloroflexota bacterium]|nr:hypothetical protein [Chloroflexota bacterium]
MDNPLLMTLIGLVIIVVVVIIILHAFGIFPGGAVTPTPTPTGGILEWVGW